ncbi:MAG: hypothetical protein JO300_15480 [Silvibacterium sp.]|nr:hypothetical protein [Silvibacterium sp.]
MTFDELWRFDPASKEEFPNASEMSDEFELIDNPISDHLASDGIDDGEIDRFLDWLEESL